MDNAFLLTQPNPDLLTKSASVFPALRDSAGCDGGEQLPVRLPGIEQCPDPVVPDVRNTERHPLHPLDEIVDRFGRSVRHSSPMPCVGDQRMSRSAINEIRVVGSGFFAVW